MKKYFLLISLIVVSVTSSMAQTPTKRLPLPPDLSKYADEYPVELMKVKSVKSRLLTLLRMKYPQFVLSMDVQSPMKMVGDFLFANGCMPHACTINEAAFVIDLRNKRIHAVLYEKDKPPVYFNEDRAPTPQILIDHVAELKSS